MLRWHFCCYANVASVRVVANYLDERNTRGGAFLFDFLDIRTTVTIVGDSETKEGFALGNLDMFARALAMYKNDVIKTNLATEHMIEINFGCVEGAVDYLQSKEKIKRLLLSLSLSTIFALPRTCPEVVGWLMS